MDELQMQIRTCHSCKYSESCMIHWGPDCKWLGGDNIPRMKTGLVKEERKRAMKMSEDPNKPRKSVDKASRRYSEPIITKTINWK